MTAIIGDAHGGGNAITPARVPAAAAAAGVTGTARHNREIDADIDAFADAVRLGSRK
jgi:hypothetical protein